MRTFTHLKFAPGGFAKCLVCGLQSLCECWELPIQIHARGAKHVAGRGPASLTEYR